MFLRLLTIFSIFFIVSYANAAGISLNQSRIVYSEQDKSQMAQIRNDTDSPLLVQASIMKEVDGQPVNIFVVTPPLFRVEPRTEFAMRVVPNKTDQLPKDRESIFYLKARAIPAISNSNENKTSMVFVTAFVIKLIYRPDSIKEPKKDDYKKVSLVKKGTTWKLDNPTPYYMTVVGLNIDGKTKQESFLIKPFDSYIIGSNINDLSKVSWYFLNDFGVNTEKQTANLN